MPEEITRITLSNERSLLLDCWPYDAGNWRGSFWRLVTSDKEHIRYLNEFEVEFIEGAINAALAQSATQLGISKKA